MASGSDIRSDISHVSNISLSSPKENDIEHVKKIKRGKKGNLEKETMTVLVEKSENSTCLL